MEKALYNWFVRRQNNFPISGDMIKEKASALHMDIQEKEGGFNASSGWMQGFKSRYGIRLLRVCGEKLSSDQQAVEHFKQKLSDVIRELQLCNAQIYNADETGLFWKMLPKKSYVSSSEKPAPGRKMEKARIIFLACTNATGEHKINPLVIGRAKNPRSFKSFNIPVDYRNSKNAWMTSVIFKDWFHTCFVPQVRQFLQLKGLPQKAVILLDNAPCHPLKDDLRTSDGFIFVIYMPPNVTPLIQPMDQNVIRITKLFYRKNLLALAVGKENITDFLKSLTLKDAVFLLLLAWNQLKIDVIEKCWRPLLKSTVIECNSYADDEEEGMSLSALRQKLLAERYEDVHYIHNLLQIISDANYTEGDIENWNLIENRELICGEICNIR